MATHSFFLGYPYIPAFNLFCSCNLQHIHYQCLSQCKLRLNCGNQRLQHPENESEITKNSETRKKLASSIKTDDSGFKTEIICWEKEGKGFKKKNVADTPCESNINTVVEKHFSPENT